VAVRTLDTWRDRAACKGPETALFFPPTSTERRDEREARERRAKSICRVCPVQRECLEYALRIGEMHGIWGGLNESERRGLLEANYS
jgi:WhiB family redox-sensing transcriptional regulator